MRSLRDVVTSLLADPEDVVLARTILGTADPDVIAKQVEDHVRRVVGREVTGCSFVTQSVGAVFGLGLDDGARVVIKVHALDGDRWRGFGSFAELEAVYDAQQELADVGFPCACVLHRPSPFGAVHDPAPPSSHPVPVPPARAAAVLADLPADRIPDPHAPDVRRALAGLLVRSIEQGSRTRARDRLPRVTLPATLYRPPHNALFDLERAGGEWIDARARTARAVLDAARAAPVVVHTDISCANVRVAAGQVVAVYDVDSLAWKDEMRALASCAVQFTYAGDPPWRLPSREEARAFVADYVLARGKPLDAEQRARLDAAAIYAMTYTARCEHGHAGNAGQMQALLRAAPDAYLT